MQVTPKKTWAKPTENRVLSTENREQRTEYRVLKFVEATSLAVQSASKLTLRSFKRGFAFGEATTLAVQSVSKLTLRSLKRGFVRSAWEVSEQERYNFVFLLAARHSSNKFGSALARSVGSPSSCPESF